MTQLTVRISTELHQELKIQAIKENRSIREIIEELITEYVEKGEK